MALLLVACEESVELGSACAPIAAVTGCAQLHPGGEVSVLRPADAGVPAGDVGGSSMDAPLLPGAPSSDGGGGAPVAVRSEPLRVDNPSFERNGGIGGDVLLDKLISLFPLINVVFAELPDWYACFPLSVSSVTLLDTPNGGLQASPTGDFLSFVINGTSVRQALPAPMVQGATYSLAFDVITDAPGVYLEARGATELCGDGVVLGRSAALATSSEWTPACLTFTADQAYDYLLLAPGYDGRAPSLTRRLRIDRLRSVESCP